MYLLLENQSTPDRLMAYRIFALMSMVWRKDIDIQRNNGIIESQLKLLPILPIVLYTGKRIWEYIPTLMDLMELPEALEQYIPNSKILFLNLEEVDTKTLHNSPTEIALRLIRAEDASEEEFRDELDKCINELQNLTNMDGMSTLIRLFVLISIYRRANTEWPLLYNIIKKSISIEGAEEEAAEMYTTMADQLIDQGKQEGIQLGKQEGIQLGKQEGIQLGKQEGIQLGKQEGIQLGKQEGIQLGKQEGIQLGKQEGIQLGKQEGKLEGQILEAHAILIDVGSERLGKPNKEVLSFINSLTDHAVIVNMIKRSYHVESWQDLLAASN